MFDDVLIMAGGAGTRLWPASNSKLPKQFLPAENNKCFFDMALERALAVAERVIIIAGISHIPHVIKCGEKLKPADKKRLLVIGEPCAKNTAPAIACAVQLSLLSKADSAHNMLVLTSDHIIKPLKTFKADAALASKATQKSLNGSLVVFGIRPTRPDTGYGYIEADNGQSLNGLYNVSAFHEKPNLKTAEKYFKDNRFFWNSGMFAFNTDFLAEQFRKNAQEVFNPFEKLKAPKATDYAVQKGVKVLKTWQGLETAYKKAQGISFDYAIAEKCKKRMMVKTNFDWIDIGDWEEYAKINKNNNSHVFIAPADGADTDSCYVDSDIPVALAGVKDLIVVIRSGKDGKPASALITRKGQTQKVKDIVELIKKSGKLDLL